MTSARRRRTYQYQRFSVAMLAQAVCLTVLRHLAGTSSLGSPTTLGAASCSLSSGGALLCLETLRMHVTAKRRCTALLPTVVPAEARKDLATPRTADSTMQRSLPSELFREDNTRTAFGGGILEPRSPLSFFVRKIPEPPSDGQYGNRVALGVFAREQYRNRVAL